MKHIQLIDDAMRQKLIDLKRTELRKSLAPELRARKRQTYEDAVRVTKEALKAKDPNTVARIRDAARKHEDVIAEAAQYVYRGLLDSSDICSRYDKLTVDQLYAPQPMYIKNRWHHYPELAKAITTY